MPLYSLFANLKARPVLVVGGGAVAARKVAGLLEAGADILLGAPELTPELGQLVAEGRARHFCGAFHPDWLDQAWLVVVATPDHALNREIALLATERKLWVNVVDDAALSSFHVPARVQRGPLVVAISSGGSAPVLARRLRERLEALLDESLGPLAELLGKYRSRIASRRPDLAGRRHFHQWLMDGPVAALLRDARPADAERALLDALRDADQPTSGGSVALIGAGPGDPGLLTLKALRALQDADVVLHDRLVSEQVIELARRDAERIDVGKRVGDNHHATQARIHRLMQDHVGAGRRVVRLKGGDPFVFGRGGEELEFLRNQGIRYEVVPGISAAVACAAYAGVPLTHRDHAQSVHLTTIQRRENLSPRDWNALARDRQTLAIYMGVAQLDTLRLRLLAHGRAGTTPFALVENGTRPEQRVITGTLDHLPALARHHQVRAPALLILGEVAALAPRLAWFGRCISGGKDFAHAA